MTPNLIRKQFLDRWWDAADFDTAAEFWLRLYEEAARAQGFTDTPVHNTAIRLRGFPRHAAGDLLKELANRVAASDFPAPEADQPDPDTLVISSGELGGEEQAPAGLGLPVVGGPAFEGLMVEFRFRVVGDEGKSLRRVELASTLVLVGELRDGRFLLKGAWRSGSHEWEDKLAWAGGWAEQDAWLAAMDRFRETGDVPRDLGKKLFVPRSADFIGGAVVKMIHVPLGKPRLGGLVRRAAGFAAVFVVLGLAIWWAVVGERWFLVGILVLVSWPVAWLAWAFARGEWRLVISGHRDFHRVYSRLTTEPVRHMALTRAETDIRFANPWLQKYTADLEAAGFRYAGDLRIEPEEVSGDGLFRAFLAPDGVTWVAVMFHFGMPTDSPMFHRTWPAAVAFLAYTFFADGGYASSVSGRTNGYRRKLTGAEHKSSVFPDEEDPIAFVRLHAAAARRFAEETGRRPLGVQPFDWFVRRQEEMYEEERRLRQGEPYTWGDHLRWCLQSPRREYRG